MRLFTCTKCGNSFTTEQDMVRNWAIDKWWKMVGQQCANCRVTAQGEPLQGTIRQPQIADAEAGIGKKQRNPETSIEMLFNEFHRLNPHVYTALVREGRFLLERGHTKLGMSMLYERLRWNVYMQTFDDQFDFKLPNNYRSYYARLIMAQEPDFAGVFNTAELRSMRRGMQPA